MLSGAEPVDEPGLAVNRLREDDAYQRDARGFFRETVCYDKDLCRQSAVFC